MKTLVWGGVAVLALLAAPVWVPFVLTAVVALLTLVAVVPAVVLLLGRLGYWWVGAALAVPALVLLVRWAAAGPRAR